jgi:hypothetical protein
MDLDIESVTPTNSDEQNRAPKSRDGCLNF